VHIYVDRKRESESEREILKKKDTHIYRERRREKGGREG